MAIDPSDYPEAQAHYLRIRSLEGDHAKLRLLKQQRQSYLAAMQHIRAQLNGTRKRTALETTEKLVAAANAFRQKHTNCVVEISDLEQALLYTLQSTTTTIHEEFRRICAIPQVIDVRLHKKHLQVVVRAVLEYKGKRYDLGDWVIPISPSPRSRGEVAYSVEIVRRSVRADIATPALYRINISPRMETFCFGDNADLIDHYFRNGRYVSGIQLAVYALCSVNPSDEFAIPKTFPTIPKENHRAAV